MYGLYIYYIYKGLNRENLRTFGDRPSYSFNERRQGLGQRDPRGRSHRSIHVNLNNKHIWNMRPLFTLLALALVCLQSF